MGLDSMNDSQIITSSSSGSNSEENRESVHSKLASSNEEGAQEPADGNDAVKKKKKKKKKGKSGSEQERVLPTQKLVDQCFPWTVVNRPNVGRCAIATREIKAGEVVVREQCVAFIPRSQDRLVVCHSCCCDISPPVPSFGCPSCHYAKYCQECKEVAIEQHKGVCKILNPLSRIAKTADCDEDLLRFVLTLACKRRPSRKLTKNVSGEAAVNRICQQGTIKDGIIYPSYEDAISLKTHREKVTKAWKQSVRMGCQLLYEELIEAGPATEDEVDLTVEKLESLAAMINTNSHGMGAHGAGVHNADVAVGIFPFVSMLSHSCRPNCCFVSEKTVMYVRATQDISKGTELYVSYINLYEPRSTRKMQLAGSKHFLCRCQRCSEPFASSVDRFLEGCMCTVRGCGGVQVKSFYLHDQKLTESESAFSSSAWECDKCSRVLDPTVVQFPTRTTSVDELPWQIVRNATERLGAAMSVYRERRFKDARVLLEHFIADFTGKLHSLHVLLFDALTPLMNCCRTLGDAAEGSRVCKMIIASMEKVLPGVSLELANFYFCLGEMYLERSEGTATNIMRKHYKKLAQESFQQVRAMRQICLGKPTLPE